MANGAALADRLRMLGRLDDSELRPAEAMLVLAGSGRAGDVTRHLDTLEHMAGLLRTRLKADDGALALAGALFGVVAGHRFRLDEDREEEGGCDDFALLLERGRGDEAALGLLALDVGRRAGLAVDALAFPARLLLRIRDGAGAGVIVDPAALGCVLEPYHLRAMAKAAGGNGAELEPGHFDALGNRALVVRLCTRIKLRLLRFGEVPQALSLVEATLALAPDEAALWREAGMMRLRLDDALGAVAALEQFVARTCNAQARARAQSLLAELRARMN